MDGLVRQHQLGDIRFGLPTDMELANRPYGFYTFLGVNRDATPEEVREAYRKRSFELHPDRNNGDDTQFKQLARIKEVLLDDGGELGHEHSKRAHYDRISGLDTYFDGHIEKPSKDGNVERTKRLSEIILIHLEMERKSAEIMHDLMEKAPDIKDLKEQIETTMTPIEAKEAAERLEKRINEVAGITPEKKRMIEEEMMRHQQHFLTEGRRFINDFRDRQRDYQSKVLDVYHVNGGNVVFGTDRTNGRLTIAGHDVKQHILELILAGDNYIWGFGQVHFKSENADIRIEDPRLRGIVHVVEGNVNVAYNSLPYGIVLRIRAPSVEPGMYFVKHGECYIYRDSASGKWWETKPALDIAVEKGSVTLSVRELKYAQNPDDIFYGDSLKKLLEGYNRKNLFKEIKEIIGPNSDNLIKNKGYNNIKF